MTNLHKLQNIHTQKSELPNEQILNWAMDRKATVIYHFNTYGKMVKYQPTPLILLVNLAPSFLRQGKIYSAMFHIPVGHLSLLLTL